MIDPITKLIQLEHKRQKNTLMLIPSENYASAAVRSAVGSVLMNKYSEGYAGRRYYEGNEIVDQIELLAIERAKKLFDVAYVNVQPYSGSPANSEILFALCDPGDTIMGLKLASGGHLTHGHPKVTFSGKFFKSVQFGLDERARINYKEMEELARVEKPKVLIVGTTAYPFTLDFKKCRKIADSIGAYLVADISHIAGLVVAGVHPSPAPYAHVIMTTTHKTLRGPRGAMIFVTHAGIKKDSDLPKKIDSAIIPGMQGGPHNNTTAGIAVALAEASQSKFVRYGEQIVKNAKALSDELQKQHIEIVGGGTENHLMILDFSASGVGKGTLIARVLHAAGIVTNRNSVPNDTSPFYPTGVRIGTPAVTTRGMKEREMKKIATWIAQVVRYVENEQLPTAKNDRAAYVEEFTQRMMNDRFLKGIAKEVALLCSKFPMP